MYAPRWECSTLSILLFASRGGRGEGEELSDSEQDGADKRDAMLGQLDWQVEMRVPWHSGAKDESKKCESGEVLFGVEVPLEGTDHEGEHSRAPHEKVVELVERVVGEVCFHEQVRREDKLEREEAEEEGTRFGDDVGQGHDEPDRLN